MAEQQVAFLYGAANSLQAEQNRTAMQLLRSHFMLRCKAICSREGKLPDKQFGPSKRCSHCGLEWRYGEYSARVLPAEKLKKGARRKLHKSEKKTENINGASDGIKITVNSNSLEKLCHFCRHKTVIKTVKPSSMTKLSNPAFEKNIYPKLNQAKSNGSERHKSSSERTIKMGPENEVDIYCNSKSVFTTNFNKADTVKIHKKACRKSKKDKFAGLCKEAVLAAAKGKLSVDSTESKLMLFLKKSQ